MSYQFADILAPDLSSSGLFRHEGDAVQLREEIVQTLHTGTKRQVGTVQTGLYVVPAVTNRNISMKEGARDLQHCDPTKYIKTTNRNRVHLLKQEDQQWDFKFYIF